MNRAAMANTLFLYNEVVKKFGVWPRRKSWHNLLCVAVYEFWAARRLLRHKQ